MNNILARFWTHVASSDGCWIWTAACDRDGYGRFKVNSGLRLAHRFSYETWIGPIPEGLLVLHSCDTPPCIRPDHLFLGTHQDNVADKVRKGRQARGKDTGMAKLTDERAREVLVALADGATQAGLARRYGVSTSAIHQIAKGIGWTHLQATL